MMMMTNLARVQRSVPANVGGTPRSSNGSRMDHWKKYCIYRVPAHMKAQNPAAYSPQLASIGPYHHGQPHLQAMEEHKARSLQRFLERAKKGYKECFEALARSAEELMSSYQSLGEEWKGASDRFVGLMVLDGAFLYEFMRGFSDSWDYDERDPVFSLYALINICPYILPDILMLENQLPFTVLERLIAVEKGQLNDPHHQEVNELVFKFWSVQPPANMPHMLGLHVLDISRKVITREFAQIGNERREPALGVKSAIELHDVGLKFRKSEIYGNGGVSFDKGTLRLPPLTFDTTTEPLFLNAIAFERLHPAANHEVSSYIAFMQGLIPSPSDVTLLRRQDLIQSKIGDDQAVAGLMKRISKNVFFDPLSDMCNVRDSLNQYYEDNTGQWRRRLREWWKTLRQGYLKNPWTITAVVAAAAILILTFLQTYYTMKGYFKGK